MPKDPEFHSAFSRALGSVSPTVVTLDQTGSTNEEARALARQGAPERTVVVANEQTAGRGRLGRTWHAELGATLTCSWIVRPTEAVTAWTLIPLMAGVACADGVRARTGVDAVLKWPNDLLVSGRKVGGLLTEAEVPDFVVVGLGLNVSNQDFPEDIVATSLALEGAKRLDRADLLAEIIRRFFARSSTDALARYRELCTTIGMRVRVERVDGSVEGEATGVDDTGALIVDGEQIAAADIVHLRPC